MKEVVIFGAGRRVQSHIIPAVINCNDSLVLSSIYARKKRFISIHNKEYQVDVINKSSTSNLQNAEMIIICVSQESVPSVLSHLLENNCADKQIFIDTPVFSGKNIRNYGLIAEFKHIFVLEDWLALNKFDLATSLIRSGKIGKVSKICFFHSGYRHHAVAIARRWTGARVIRSINHKKYSSNFNEFYFKDDSGVISWILEPRDYEYGSFLIMGELGTISDYALDTENHYFIDTKVVNNKLVTSIKYDNKKDKLGAYFVDLEAEIPVSGMNAMDVMKIDALTKMLRSESNIGANELRYPVLDALYDKLLIDCSMRWGRFYDISFRNIGFIKFVISRLICLKKWKEK